MLPATVSVVESLGHERHVICRLEDGQMVIVRQQSSEPAPGRGLDGPPRDRPRSTCTSSTSTPSGGSSRHERVDVVSFTGDSGTLGALADVGEADQVVGQRRAGRGSGSAGAGAARSGSPTC